MHKTLMKHTLGRFGYRLVRDKPMDLRSNGDSLGSAIYRWMQLITHNHRAVVNAEISSGRGLRVYPLDPNGCHPFVVATRQALASDRPRDTIEQILFQYTEIVQPVNALEKMGLEPQDAPLLKAAAPLGGYVITPWMPYLDGTAEAVERFIEQRMAHYEAENHERGVKQPFSQSGFVGYGPVSREKLALEANRLFELIQSIQKDGYKRDDNKPDGDINVTVLRSNGEYRWLINWGHHRAAVMAAMGATQIPVRISAVVNREEVDFWFNVRSGVFTREGALKYFDRLFAATLAPIDQKWEGYVRQNLGK